MGPPRQPGPSGRGPSMTDGKGPMDHRPGLMGPPRPPGPPGQYGMRGQRPWGQQGPRGPPPKGLLGHSPWDHGSGPWPRGPGPQGPGDMHGQQDQGFRHQGRLTFITTSSFSHLSNVYSICVPCLVSILTEV